MADLPIIMNTPEVVKPEGTHYVVASNGAFLVLENDWVSATVPAKAIPNLGEVELRARWKLPPIPTHLIYQVAKFFREVRDDSKCEAAVLLHYGDGEWAVTVPKQDVQPAHVHWDWTSDMRVAGKRCVGTIHSHVDMSAHHSGTDVDDEAQMDGLHVTLGCMDELPKQLDADAEVVVRGERFKIPLDRVADGFAFTEIKKKKYHWSRDESRFKVADRGAWDATEVPADWADKLTATSWRSRFGNFGMGDDHFE